MEATDVAIVAGVGPGAGAALARAFAREGYP
jgi:NAD(P)-dependent dehydrogenase (short-subunit alcohol dehydrogenase family)